MNVLSGNTLFAPPETDMRRRPDGTVLLSCRARTDGPAPSVVESVRRWAAVDPAHPLVARRGPGGAWECRRYGEVVAAADAIGQALLERGLGPERPLLILSGNAIEHLLITLGAMTAGVPVIPTSVAYSLLSSDYQRIREIAALVRPGAVFADDGLRFQPALDALGEIPAIVARNPPPGANTEPLDTLLATTAGPELADAYGALTPDSVAKILFTSGSTGTPKGVLNTHRMLSSNQQAIARIWPFLSTDRPVLLDWLPWSHTFGGNHNVNMVLTHGGTLYIEDSRPTPADVPQMVANLADVRPTMSFNVPAAWALLAPALETDRESADRFFSRLRLMFNAAAALPAVVRQRLESLALEVSGRRIPVTGSWGSTETAPAVTSAHYDFSDARCIGVPIPGAELKLVPDQGAYEVRVRGPMVTPGYLRAAELTAAAFDEEGFYRTGDAVDFADPADPDAGLVFRGRTAEDFKLDTGTFVHVGAVRTALLSAVPVLSDAVIVGENRDCVCALAWLNQGETQALFGAEPLGRGEVVEHAGLAAHIGKALREHNRNAGSATRIQRLLLLGAPPGLDAGEITDKGYVNQRRVITLRADYVEQLYFDDLPSWVISAP
jgi:feruloyl-CoA synthase